MRRVSAGDALATDPNLLCINASHTSTIFMGLQIAVWNFPPDMAAPSAKRSRKMSRAWEAQTHSNRE